MAKHKEEPVREQSRAERMAQKMAERIRESRALEEEYESTLDPRQAVHLGCTAGVQVAPEKRGKIA